MGPQFHYLLARGRQAELADRSERAWQVREARRPDATTGNARFLDRVVSALLLRDAALSPSPAADGRSPDIDRIGAAVGITLRLAGDADGDSIADLAGLDSARVPAAPVLIADEGGQIRAALSLHDGALVADPFHPTLVAQQLLRVRAAQLRGDRGHSAPRRLFGRADAAARPATGLQQCINED